MSYTSIPNQPIIFNSQLPEACEGCGSEFAQLADYNDQLFWQIEAGRCGHVRFNEYAAVNDVSVDGFNITFPTNLDDSAGVTMRWLWCRPTSRLSTLNP